jgi:predicted esterase
MPPLGGFDGVASNINPRPETNITTEKKVARRKLSLLELAADLAAAISFIFRNADALGVSTEDYALWGSSAGARMAASIGSHGVAAFGGDNIPKPSTVVMAYTAHSGTASEEPPRFVVVGKQDPIAPPAAIERRVAALRQAGTQVEYRTYQHLGHGFGRGTGTSAEGWIADAIQFWEKFMKNSTR